jgi:hypothetical protein
MILGELASASIITLHKVRFSLNQVSYKSEIRLGACAQFPTLCGNILGSVWLHIPFMSLNDQMECSHFENINTCSLVLNVIPFNKKKTLTKWNVWLVATL